ncbi:MAG: QueT transporter family protein, partial [Bacillota bacterium]
YLSYILSKRSASKAGRWLVPAPAVLVNALVVGWLLADVYGVGAPYWVCALYVAAGQLVACYGLGMPLLLLLERYKQKLF